MKNILSRITIIFLLISVVSNAQNIINTLAPNGSFKIKDGTTDYFILNQENGTINLVSPIAGNLRGSIYKGVNRFLHTYYGAGTDGFNTFLGLNSGNFTIGGSLFFEGSFNTGIGYQSLTSLTTGYSNSAFGANSLKSNTTGLLNSAFGTSSLENNISGIANSAFGWSALFSNVSGNYNSAFGNSTLWYNKGNNNSAFGSFALQYNNIGEYNSAFGNSSLGINFYGSYNSAFGVNSLFNNDGNHNSAFGFNSLFSNINGYQNSAFGVNSLYSNYNGWHNTAVGYDALRNNVDGFQNTAVGHHSLQNNTGNYNTAIGYNAGSTVTTGANLTLIGIDANPSSPTAIDQITLGNQFVSSLRCNVQTITSLSDARDKKNIKDLTLGLDFITKLKPRQFNWDKREWYDDNKSDGSKIQEEPTAGFIAQEFDELQKSENAEWLNLVLKDNPDKWEATYGNLLPVMVKAIQELKAEKDKEITELTIQNEKLKIEKDEEIAELKSRIAKYEEMQTILVNKIEKIESKEQLQRVQVINSENNNQ